MSLRGVVVGGPYDGVLLKADESWSGTLKTHPNQYYAWDASRAEWTWRERVETKEVRR